MCLFVCLFYWRASLLTSLHEYLFHFRYIIICFTYYNNNLLLISYSLIKFMSTVLTWWYFTFLFLVLVWFSQYTVCLVYFRKSLIPTSAKDFLLKNTTSFLRVLACFPVFPHSAPSFRQTSSIPRSKFLCHFNNTHFDATIEGILWECISVFDYIEAVCA